MTKQEKRLRIGNALILAMIILMVPVLIFSVWLLINKLTNPESKESPVRFLRVESSSMEPTIHKGGYVLVYAADFEKLQLDDIITFKQLDGKYNTHRIIALENGIITTKGDNNPFPDERSVGKSEYCYKLLLIFNGTGDYVRYIVLPALALLLLVAALLIIPRLLRAAQRKKRRALRAAEQPPAPQPVQPVEQGGAEHEVFTAEHPIWLPLENTGTAKEAEATLPPAQAKPLWEQTEKPSAATEGLWPAIEKETRPPVPEPVWPTWEYTAKPIMPLWVQPEAKEEEPEPPAEKDTPPEPNFLAEPEEESFIPPLAVAPEPREEPAEIKHTMPLPSFLEELSPPPGYDKDWRKRIFSGFDFSGIDLNDPALRDIDLKRWLNNDLI